MGEKETRPFQFSFNGLLKVNFQGSRLTSDGGLILVRELDERLGLGHLIEEHLTDSRQGSNKKFPLADLLRQSVIGVRWHGTLEGCLKNRLRRSRKAFSYGQTESFGYIEWVMRGLQETLTCFQEGTESTISVTEIQIGNSG